MRTIRIVIADDHLVVRQGMRTLLDLDPELQVVGEASNGAEALEVARSLKPDVVAKDLRLRTLLRQPVKTSQRIRRYRRPVPLNNIPVLVIMRRFNEYEREAAFCGCIGHYGRFYTMNGHNQKLKQ